MQLRFLLHYKAFVFGIQEAAIIDLDALYFNVLLNNSTCIFQNMTRERKKSLEYIRYTFVRRENL